MTKKQKIIMKLIEIINECDGGGLVVADPELVGFELSEMDFGRLIDVCNIKEN